MNDSHAHKAKDTPMSNTTTFGEFDRRQRQGAVQRDPQDFSQDVRYYNAEDPRNFSNRNPQNTTAIVILCLVFLALIVAAVVLGVSLQGITNGAKEGCTLNNYDNYQRGFGIDNGSCLVVQPVDENVKRVVGCPSEALATFFDAGGADAGYQTEEQAAYSTETRFVAEESESPTNALCFTFLSFDVNGGGQGNCDAASLNVTGSLFDDGVYCDHVKLDLNKPICTAPGGEITFNFTTDGTTDGSGWEAEIRCGVPGCTTRGYDNFNEANGLDDGTCRSDHPTSAGSTDIMQLCGAGTYYDSGGPDENYASREFIQKAFNASEPNKKLCFYFHTFDVEAVNVNTCKDSLTIDESDNHFDGPHCTGNTGLQGERVCSKPNDPIYFQFASDATGTAPGWEALITCEDA